MDPADADALDGQVVAIMASAGRTVTSAEAAIIRGRILGKKRLRDPAAYVASTVRRDPAAAARLLPRVNGHRPAAATFTAPNPEIARRGAAYARQLLAARTAAAEPYEPPDDPEEFPF